MLRKKRTGNKQVDVRRHLAKRIQNTVYQITRQTYFCSEQVKSFAGYRSVYAKVFRPRLSKQSLMHSKNTVINMQTGIQQIVGRRQTKFGVLIFQQRKVL